MAGFLRATPVIDDQTFVLTERFRLIKLGFNGRA